MIETEPKEDKPWKIDIHSETNTNGLTGDQLKDVLDTLNNDYHVEYQKNWNKKMQDEYDQYSVAKWQNKKSTEVEELFKNALKYNIDGDKVSVDVSFQVSFTNNFTKGDVYEWVKGLNRLVSTHAMIQMEKIINSHKEERPFDEDLSKREREFLINLTKSQRWEVKKLN